MCLYVCGVLWCLLCLVDRVCEGLAREWERAATPLREEVEAAQDEVYP